MKELIKKTKLYAAFYKVKTKSYLRKSYLRAKKLKDGEYESYLIERTYEFFKKYDYSRPFAYRINFENPTSFTEKMQWIKLYDQNKKKTLYTDKYEVRKHIAKVLGEEYLIPLIRVNGKDVFQNPKEIDFSKLPNKFVIKCTHGSHMNIIVKDKNSLTKSEITRIKRKLNKWLKIDYSCFVGLELQYRDIKPRIIIEKYMDDGNRGLCDYKIFCFSGEPKFLSLNFDRGTDKYTETYFDLDFSPLNFVLGNHPTKKDIIKPKELSELIKLSEKLAEDFTIVRTDFYIIDGRIYFGELTFSPGSGFDFPNPITFDKPLGKLLRINKDKRKIN